MKEQSAHIVLMLLCVLMASAPACVTPRASGVHLTNRPFVSEEDGRVSIGQRVNIGEVSQYVDIYGRDEKQPVLLYLHGGPGRSSIPSAHLYAESLARHYVTVHWDQRGTQRSFSDELEDFPLTFERLVSDTLELSEQLANWFDEERIVLVAEGVAALSALKAAQRRPEAFYALVLMSPIIDGDSSLLHSYQWVLSEAHDTQRRDALSALQPLGPPPWRDALMPQHYTTLCHWLDRLGGTVPKRDAAQMRRELESAAPAGQRTRPDLALRGEAYSLERLWPELLRHDLVSQVPALDVPIFLVAGEESQRAPLAQVERFYQALDARRGKTLFKLDGVGHWPLLEVPERVVEILVSRVRPMAR